MGQQNDINKKVGKRIAELGKEMKLTQSELAEKIKLSGEYISRLERGVNAPIASNPEFFGGSIGSRTPRLDDFFRLRERLGGGDTGGDSFVQKHEGAKLPEDLQLVGGEEGVKPPTGLSGVLLVLPNAQVAFPESPPLILSNLAIY